MRSAETLASASATSRPGRVIVTKAGMDGHDRGAKVVARLLRDAGFEVIYTGLYQTPESIVSAALQEDVDAIGISVLSAAHNHIFGETLRLMKEQRLDDVILFGGGIIPADDLKRLEQLGVRKLFVPGASGPEIVEFLRSAIAKRRNGGQGSRIGGWEKGERKQAGGHE